jgi:hypothetical protein
MPGGSSPSPFPSGFQPTCEPTGFQPVEPSVKGLERNNLYDFGLLTIALGLMV